MHCYLKILSNAPPSAIPQLDYLSISATENAATASRTRASTLGAVPIAYFSATAEKSASP